MWSSYWDTTQIDSTPTDGESMFVQQVPQCMCPWHAEPLQRTLANVSLQYNIGMAFHSLMLYLHWPSNCKRTVLALAKYPCIVLYVHNSDSNHMICQLVEYPPHARTLYNFTYSLHCASRWSVYVQYDIQYVHSCPIISITIHS